MFSITITNNQEAFLWNSDGDSSEYIENITFPCYLSQTIWRGLQTFVLFYRSLCLNPKLHYNCSGLFEHDKYVTMQVVQRQASVKAALTFILSNSEMKKLMKISNINSITFFSVFCLWQMGSGHYFTFIICERTARFRCYTAFVSHVHYLSISTISFHTKRK